VLHLRRAGARLGSGERRRDRRPGAASERRPGVQELDGERATAKPNGAKALPGALPSKDRSREPRLTP